MILTTQRAGRRAAQGRKAFLYVRLALWCAWGAGATLGAFGSLCLGVEIVTKSLADGTVVQTVQGGDAKAAQPEQPPAGAATPPPGDQPKQEKPADAADKDKAAAENKDASKEAGGPIQRPTQPDFKPDADELKVEPKNGKVQFSFYGQPWKDVVQWYADISGTTFDYLEVPEGFVNLTTTRAYTLPETRDLLNRLLLARGYTLLLSGPDTLRLEKIEKLEPSLVPTVDPDMLEDHQPYDFVKVRFSLPPAIEPAKAAEDVKILLSPQAKVTPLLTTRRLLVIDAVSNLRGVRDLLYEEQSAVREDERPRVFMVKYRRAEYIADQIMILLGLDPASRKNPMEQQLEQQRIGLLMQLSQKGTDVAPMLRKDGPPVFISTDKVRNVVLVNAPPDMMPTIERIVETFDVPDDGGEVAQAGNLELRRYKTLSANTDALVTALKEIGSLHPLTQLQGDSASKTIFAYATQDDHTAIQGMLDKLDASGRALQVIYLSQRTPAERIAGTIQALMVGEKESESNSRRSRYSFYGYGEESNEDESEFRIQADVENNRLLLWASEAEYAEVKELLKKLGAVASDEVGNPSPVRVLEARSPEETAALLEQLQKAWGGKNRLQIQGTPPRAKPLPRDDQGPQRDDDKEKLDQQEARDKLTLKEFPRRSSEHGLDTMASRSPSVASTRFRLIANDGLTDQERSDERSDQALPQSAATQPTSDEHGDAPPVTVTVTPDGRLVLSSADPMALDQLESLISDLAPANNEFEVFTLKNARASLVELNLRDYFKEELAGQTEAVYDEWGEYSGRREKKQGIASLSKRPLLKFIWDNDTDTIVVQNASSSQLATIRKLIEIYDQPIGEDSVARRRTEAIKIQYSTAQNVAASIKEVYRDLLSSKDKEFQGKDGKNVTTRNETYYRFPRGDDDSNSANNKKSAPMKLAFEGVLSVGVDEVSNSLIISAEENVWEKIHELVVQLDEAAKPNTMVHIHEVRSRVSTAQLQKALAEALGQPWAGGKPPAQAAAKAAEDAAAKAKEGEAKPAGDAQANPANNQ